MENTIPDGTTADDGSNNYTIQVDVPNLNNLLNMYNFHSENMTTNTVTPNPYSSNIGNYCPINDISQLYDNVEPLYITEIKDIKKSVLDILHKKTNFEDEEFDEEKYSHSEIDTLYKKIKDITVELKGLQVNLNNAEENLNEEIKKVNENIEKIDNFIKFLESLSSLDHENIKEIISNITKLATKLSNIESFKKAKKEYATERRNILKYIYFLRKVNKMNVTNMCVVCMDEPVSHFLDPCGHTFCKTCLQKSLEVESFVNENENYIYKNCPVCRKYVNKARPLYFL